jgi:hypothetical protein
MSLFLSQHIRLLYLYILSTNKKHYLIVTLYWSTSPNGNIIIFDVIKILNYVFNVVMLGYVEELAS